MNHLPYRDWLLSEDRLSDDQAGALQEHIRSCEPCRQLEAAWTDVNALFLKVPPVEPAPDFSARWQTRLVAHHLHKQRRLAWIIVGLFTATALILIVLFGAQLLELLRSPGNLLLVWMSRITGILSIYWALQNIFTAITAQLPGISWLLVIFGTGFISFLSVLWLATYRKLSTSWRVI